MTCRTLRVTYSDSLGVDTVLDEFHASFELVLVKPSVEKLGKVLQDYR